MRHFVKLLICFSIFFSCNPSDDALPVIVQKLQITTLNDSLVSNNGQIKLPKAAQTGTAFYYKSQQETSKIPIIMISGKGLSDYIFRQTPDGRDSWADIFSRSGHDVYVYNDPSLLLHDEVDYAPIMPYAKKLDKKVFWKEWGFGLEYPNHFENTRYPVEELDSLVANMPYYTDYSFLDSIPSINISKKAPKLNSPSKELLITVANLKTLINQVKDCILMVHSTSCETGYEYIKMENGTFIRALINLEPTINLTQEAVTNKQYLNIPKLNVYGDYLNEKKIAKQKLTATKINTLINSKNGKAQIIDLPKDGIEGNSHLIMQDDNNGLLASIIIEWIDSVIKK